MPSWPIHKWLASIIFSTLFHSYVEQHFAIPTLVVEYVFTNQPLYGWGWCYPSITLVIKLHLNMLSSSTLNIYHPIVSNFVEMYPSPFWSFPIPQHVFLDYLSFDLHWKISYVLCLFVFFIIIFFPLTPHVLLIIASIDLPLELQLVIELSFTTYQLSLDVFAIWAQTSSTWQHAFFDSTKPLVGTYYQPFDLVQLFSL